MSRVVSIRSVVTMTMVLSTVACGGGTDVEAERERMLATDREFAQAAGEFGAAQAFYMYTADDAVWLPDGSRTVIGPEAIRDALAEHPGMSLDWTPIDGAVAASGDLGYTWGTWEAAVPDAEAGGTAVATGHYLTVWRRNADGSWKVALDIGNEATSPGPELDTDAGP